MTGNLFNFPSVWPLTTLSSVFSLSYFYIERWSRKDVKDILFFYKYDPIYVAFSWVAMGHDLFSFRIISELLPDIQGWALPSAEK